MVYYLFMDWIEVVGISAIGIEKNKKTEFLQKFKHFSVTEVQE